MQNQPPIQFHTALLHPKYWLIWLGFGVMRMLVLLPLTWQMWLGKHLGVLCYHLLKSRRHTAQVNVALCFPHLTAEAKTTLVRQVFINTGIGIFESCCAWWQPTRFKNRVSISGLEHLQTAQENGKAVLLYGAHYTLLDLGGLLCSWFFRADIVYRPQNSPLLEWFIHKGRASIFGTQIGFRNTRGIAKSLKSGHVLWYTPDQDFGLQHGVMAQFFGVPAATITAGRRLAKIGDTQVMAVHFYRETAQNSQNTQANSDIAKHTTTQHHGRRPHYHISITPALENYPSNDELADANRVNQLLENLITKDVSQYMWFHRRFKTQPDSVNFYAHKHR